MPATDWSTHINRVVDWINDGRLSLAEKCLRSILANFPPPYYDIRCVILLAYCVDDRTRAKSLARAADSLLHHWYLTRAVETTTANGRRLMDKLQGMLDDLDGKLFADQLVDDDFPGVMVENPVKFSKDAEEESQDSKSQQRNDFQSKTGRGTALTKSNKLERERDDDDFTFFLPGIKENSVIFQKPPPFRSVIRSFLPLHDCHEDSPKFFFTNGKGSGCAICGNTNIENVRTARTARNLAEYGSKERILAAESALHKWKLDNPAEGEEELVAESAEGDLFEEDAEMAGQKEKESQAEEEETVVIKSDGVDFESRDLPLGPPASNPRSRNTNKESLSTEQSLMLNDTDKSKGRSSGFLSSLWNPKSPLKKQFLSRFNPVKSSPDSTHDLVSGSRIRQSDAAISPTPGRSENKKAVIPGPSVSKPHEVQDRNIALPGLSTPHIEEKQDTKIDKPKMIPKDVPDELSSDGDVAGGKGEKATMSEILHSDQHEEALKSRPSSPTKLKHSASARSSRTHPTTFDCIAPVTAKAAPVSVQAESSRSLSQPMAGTAQSELPRAHSTPLLGTSQNVGPIQKDGQTAAQESLRSSLKDSLNSGWTSTKSGIGSTIGTLGRFLTHRSKRRPESTVGSELGDDSQEGSTAGRDKRNKRKKDKKSSPALDTVFDPPPRK
ncbi:hypothetical protein KCU93_g3023, partial [Aureobasidium melanogenum]